MRLVNKKFTLIALIVVVILFAAGLFRYFTKADSKTALNVAEKQWIEKNKNNLIDLAIPSDTPVLSDNGEGVIFDFLSDLEKNTGLDFNKISYTSKESSSSDYKVMVTDSKKDNDILLYRDNYAIITKSKVQYASTSDIKNIVLGVLSDDMTKVSKYLSGSNSVTYKSYDDTSSMISDMSTDNIDAIVLPKLSYLNTIIKSKNLYIAYNITDYTKDYVLRLGNNSTLNKILNKYYEKWESDNLPIDFNKNLIDTYFDVKKIDEKEQVKFRSKRYSYGFVLNMPFDVTTKDGLKGFNYSFLSNFAKASNVEIDYKKYSSISNMMNDFEANKLDVVFDYSSKEKFNMDTFKTTSVYDEKVAIISASNMASINSVNSLVSLDEYVYTVKDSKIDSYLNKKGVKTKTFDNSESLINHLNKDNIGAIDYYTYDAFIRDSFKDFKLLNTIKLDSDYGFISRDIKANKTFNELFDFYLSFIDSNKVINESYSDIVDYNLNDKLFKTLIAIISAILLVVFGVIIGRLLKRRKNHNKRLSKTDKLRYVDTLTSLKNRNYLNDNLSAWDNSKVYPQSIIVVDLNNIAYINDNFGHTEGDKVIVEAASILIANQVEGSEIIRTSGNEFLIFMIGYDEKMIISYIRKLNKEFKNISHGFGAALGYSMIEDEIKTVDDAINEATSDMRSNKEEDR